MRVLAVVHQPDAGSGVFAEAVRGRGHELVEWTPPGGANPPLEGVDAALVFGGGMHADQEDRHPWLAPEKELLRELLRRELPVLGVCLGSQLLAEAAGARPRRAAQPEIGWHPVELMPAAADDPLLGGLPGRFDTLQWHSYEFPLPPRALALARSEVCLQAYRLPGPAWGLQFHAEVTLESVRSWLRRYREDEDAIRAGVDPAALEAETRWRIEGWNELGRGVCERFLQLAETVRAEPGR